MSAISFALKPLLASGGVGGGAGSGAAVGAVAGPIGAAVGALVGGLLGGILGGGTDTPTAKQVFIQKLRDELPDQNAPAAGIPLDFSPLGGGGPVWIVIDPNDPNNWTRASIEYFIAHQGLGTLMEAFIHYLSPSPTGHPTFDELAAQPTQTSAGPITVIVNDVNTVTQQALDSIAAAVNTGVTSAVDSSVDVIKSLVGGIGDVLKDVAGKIWDGLKAGIEAIASNIGNIISAIGKNIGAILKDVVSALGTAITDLKNVLVDAISHIAPILDSITKTVKNINDTLIQPIATFINTTVKTIADLTVAIQKDLHEGLAGIVNIPGQIAGGLSTIDASLNRTVEQLGKTNQATATSTVDYEGKTLPPLYSASTAAMLTGKTVAGTIKSTFAQSVNLAPETLQQVSQEAIAALGPLLKEVLEIVWTIVKSPFDQQHADWSAVENVFIGLLDGVLSILTTLTAVGALVEPLLEAASEEARTRVPITKLDVNSIVSALRRGFLDDNGASVELQKLGFDSTRQQVLKDLAVTLATPEIAIGWWFQGIIAEDDLDANLKGNGFTPDDISALKQGSMHLPQVADIARWRHFGIIQDDGVRNLLKVLRFDDTQIQAFLDTEQTRETAAGRAQLQGRLDASDQGWLHDTFLQATPDNVVTAGAREGLHPDTTRLAWLAHWNLPSIQQWINSYFRGLRTLTEVEYAMTAANIPKEVWDETIQVMRPLIPFRSISTYVKAGYMSELQAEQELAAHGFDLGRINVILKAVTASSGKSAAITAQKIATLSISNARTLFDDGALTEQQYEQVLQQHGYSAELAAAQVQADQISAHTRQRKTTLNNLLAEVETGSTTIDDAVSQLQAQGFSNSEISVFQLKVARTMKVNAKHPSIGDMKAFIKAGYMTVTQFVLELQAQGWTDPWITMFAQMETPPNTTTPGTAGTP